MWLWWLLTCAYTATGYASQSAKSLVPPPTDDCVSEAALATAEAKVAKLNTPSNFVVWAKAKRVLNKAKKTTRKAQAVSDATAAQLVRGVRMVEAVLAVVIYLWGLSLAHVATAAGIVPTSSLMAVAVAWGAGHRLASFLPPPRSVALADDKLQTDLDAVVAAAPSSS